jgi:quercetin dioxygenase-like cupin family protein
MATSPKSTTQSVQPGLDLDDGRVIMGKKLETDVQETSSSEHPSHDTSITKVNARYSPRGRSGQKYLASGVKLSMRLWEQEQPGKPKSVTQRPYETIGYVVSGRAELEIEGQTVMLAPGDSWVVPKGSRHRYNILEPFTAVEATCPPAEVHGRDEESITD